MWLHLLIFAPNQFLPASALTLALSFLRVLIFFLYTKKRNNLCQDQRSFFFMLLGLNSCGIMILTKTDTLIGVICQVCSMLSQEEHYKVLFY